MKQRHSTHMLVVVAFLLLFLSVHNFGQNCGPTSAQPWSTGNLTMQQHTQLLREMLATLNTTMPLLRRIQPQQIVPPPDNFAWVHHVGRARSACTGLQPASGLKLQTTSALIAPVVIVAYNRVHYLGKCLTTLLRYWSEDAANAERFPLFVSIDGGDPATTTFASALALAAQVQVIHNSRDTSRCQPNQGYCNLSVHYHMLMQLFFECLKAPRLLFLEEDLEVAPDFFSYFRALAPVLDQDSSLLCISSWNDHGQRGRASNATALYRTDIFPGLGWMMAAAVGKQLYPKWPDAYWDDWLRLPENRRGRQCVFPEVPRTHTFGKDGTSGGVLFEQHLKPMLLNKDNISWSQQDVSYLRRDAYATTMAGWLAAAERIGPDAVGAYCRVAEPDDASHHADLVVRYSDINHYKVLAQQLAPMLPDLQGGKLPMPRAAYKGVVTVRCRGRRLFIAPEEA